MLTTTRLLRSGLFLGLLMITPATALADEPPATVAGGYSFLQEFDTAATTGAKYTSGWFAGATRRIFAPRMSAIGEVTRSSRTNVVSETQSLLALLGGVRIELLRLGPLRLSGAALVGVERFSEPGFAENGLAIEPGAGADVWILRRLGLRVTAGYRLVRAEGTTFEEVRASAGAVIRLGGD